MRAVKERLVQACNCRNVGESMLLSTMKPLWRPVMSSNPPRTARLTGVGRADDLLLLIDDAERKAGAPVEGPGKVPLLRERK